jgi:PTH1 family peptidyl-tRNA hydrolase
MKFLIVGLGNPGSEYANTRHNIGFDVVNAFVAKHYKEDGSKSKGGMLSFLQNKKGPFEDARHAYKAEVKWKGKIFICICPTTYMNLSGKAVKYWLDKEKLGVENMLVIVDEIALPLSKLRLRASGSDAGHNGLRSIQDTLGTDAYPRLRFGIGNNFPKGMQADYVLGKWLKEEELLVNHKIQASVEVIETFAAQGITTAMNQVNNKDFSL